MLFMLWKIARIVMCLLLGDTVALSILALAPDTSGATILIIDVLVVAATFYATSTNRRTQHAYAHATTT